MEKNAKTNVNDELQRALADRHHTCICDDDLGSWNGYFVPGTTKVLLANLSEPTREAPAGRMVFYSTKCGKCRRTVLHGESCADYRATGEKLLTQVSEVVARRLQLSALDTKKLLNPSIKRFGFKKSESAEQLKI